MATRLVIIDANSILKLLIHYTDGQDIPLDAELTGAGVNPMLQRMVGLAVKSDKWPDNTKLSETGIPEPLHIRYQGKRVVSWTDHDAASLETREWKQRNETPEIQ